MPEPHVCARAADIVTGATLHQNVHFHIITKDSEWVEVRGQAQRRKSNTVAPNHVACFAAQRNSILE